MALIFPNFDPVAIAIGPLQIRWYALGYLAGFILGWAYARWIVKRDEPLGLRPNRVDVDDYLSFAVMGVILGGRLGYVLFYQPAYYLQNPSDILQVWHGGMSFHGGVLGVVLSILLYGYFKKIPIFRLGDLFAVCCTFGLFFGRIANFINGELYGRATDVPWGMVFPGGGDVARHPSQLYEAGLEGILLFIVLSALILNDKIRSRPGIVAGAFLIGYGFCRMFVELFREPDSYLGFLSGGLTMGQWLCVPMILVGTAFITMAVRKARV